MAWGSSGGGKGRLQAWLERVRPGRLQVGLERQGLPVKGGYLAFSGGSSVGCGGNLGKLSVINQVPAA